MSTNPAQRARRRARALRERGDLDGARRALEQALDGAEELERATLEADLAELGAESALLETRAPGARGDAVGRSGNAGGRGGGGAPACSDGIVGRSEAMERLRGEIVKAAASSVPLHIEGPSGSGKELVARAVHARSSRAALPFVAVSAASLNASLFEDELFGHAPGAFTGATDSREGLLAAAAEGTLLLDLVDDLTPDVQAKLLRVLEGGEGRPLGGGAPVKLEARLLTTARRPIGPLVRAGTFREDLLFRFKVLSISVPPLRERAEDLPDLIGTLLARHAAGRPPRIEPAVLERFATYSWPGNVRELENELRRLLALRVDPIGVSSLAPAIRSGRPPQEKDLSTGLYERLRGRTLEDVERSAILAALRSCGGNRTRAAKMLQVSRRALYDKLRRLGIEPG